MGSLENRLEKIFHCGVSPAQKVIMLSIAFHTDENGECNKHSLTDIEFETGLSRTAVQKGIKDIEAMKLIRVIKKNGRNAFVLEL